MKAFIIGGIDTGIGKTTVAAMLTVALDANYWKPLQSGIEGGTDTQRVQALTGFCPMTDFCQNAIFYRVRSRRITRPNLIALK